MASKILIILLQPFIFTGMMSVFHQLQKSKLSTDAEQYWIFVIRTPCTLSEDWILHGNSSIPACCHPNSTLGNNSRVNPHL